MIQLCR